jgi:elongation factor Ts
VIVEVNIQTDFAARNEDFLAFVDDVVAAASKAAVGADLGSERAPRGAGTLEEQRQALVGKLGENITVRRWERLAVAEQGLVHSYVHMGGKVGVLLAVETGKGTDAPALSTFVEETAMQIAAMAPQFVSATAVPDSEKDRQRTLFNSQLEEEGKPEAARPKIIEGKLAKWMKEASLLDQASVIDAEKTVEQVRAAAEKAFGAGIKVKGFIRYERGEGLDAPAGVDFADEARRMAGQS